MLLGVEYFYATYIQKNKGHKEPGCLTLISQVNPYPKLITEEHSLVKILTEDGFGLPCVLEYGTSL